MLVRQQGAMKLAATGEGVDGQKSVQAAVLERGSACMKAAWHHQIVFPPPATLEEDNNSCASTTFIYRNRKENKHVCQSVKMQQ